MNDQPAADGDAALAKLRNRIDEIDARVQSLI